MLLWLIVLPDQLICFIMYLNFKLKNIILFFVFQFNLIKFGSFMLKHTYTGINW